MGSRPTRLHGTQYHDLWRYLYARLGYNVNALVFLSHPADIQAVLTADAQQFDSSRANGILGSLVGENSLLLLDGSRHKPEKSFSCRRFTAIECSLTAIPSLKPCLTSPTVNPLRKNFPFDRSPKNLHDPTIDPSNPSVAGSRSPPPIT